MKRIILVFILTIISVLFFSCGTRTSHLNFKLGEDGLIYNTNNDRLFTGTIIDTADVVIEFQVVKGKKNGSFKTYYLNGQIEKSGYIINNDNVGEWKYYYPNGQIESRGNFENNIPEGKWVSYYKDGNIKCEGKYKNGKQDDNWIYYNENGQIINIKLFKNGVFVNKLQNLT